MSKELTRSFGGYRDAEQSARAPRSIDAIRQDLLSLQREESSLQTKLAKKGASDELEMRLNTIKQREQALYQELDQVEMPQTEAVAPYERRDAKALTKVEIVLPKLKDGLHVFVTGLKTKEEVEAALKKTKEDISRVINRINHYNDQINRRGIVADMQKKLYGLMMKVSGEEKVPEEELEKAFEEQDRLNLLKDMLEAREKDVFAAGAQQRITETMEDIAVNAKKRLETLLAREKELVQSLVTSLGITELDIDVLIMKAEGKPNKAPSIIKHAAKEMGLQLDASDVQEYSRILAELVSMQNDMSHYSEESLANTPSSSKQPYSGVHVIGKRVIAARTNQSFVDQAEEAKEYGTLVGSRRPTSTEKETMDEFFARGHAWNLVHEKERTEPVEAFLKEAELLKDRVSFLAADAIAATVHGNYETREKGDAIAERLEEAQAAIFDLQDAYTSIELNLNNQGKQATRQLISQITQAFNLAQSSHTKSELYFAQKRGRQVMGYAGSIGASGEGYSIGMLGVQPERKDILKPLAQSEQTPWITRQEQTIEQLFASKKAQLDDISQMLHLLEGKANSHEIDSEDLEATHDALVTVRDSFDDTIRAPLQNNPTFQQLREKLLQYERRFAALKQWKETGILPESLKLSTEEQVKIMQDCFALRDQVKSMVYDPSQRSALTVMDMYKNAVGLQGKIDARHLSDYTADQIRLMRTVVDQSADYGDRLLADPVFRVNAEVIYDLTHLLERFQPLRDPALISSLTLEQAKDRLQQLGALKRIVLEPTVDQLQNIALSPAAEKVIDLTDTFYNQVTSALEMRIQDIGVNELDSITAKINQTPLTSDEAQAVERLLAEANAASSAQEQTAEKEQTLQDVRKVFLSLGLGWTHIQKKEKLRTLSYDQIKQVVQTWEGYQPRNRAEERLKAAALQVAQEVWQETAKQATRALLDQSSPEQINIVLQQWQEYQPQNPHEALVKQQAIEIATDVLSKKQKDAAESDSFFLKDEDVEMLPDPEVSYRGRRLTQEELAQQEQVAIEQKREALKELQMLLDERSKLAPTDARDSASGLLKKMERLVKSFSEQERQALASDIQAFHQAFEAYTDHVDTYQREQQHLALTKAERAEKRLQALIQGWRKAIEREQAALAEKAEQGRETEPARLEQTLLRIVGFEKKPSEQALEDALATLVEHAARKPIENDPFVTYQTYVTAQEKLYLLQREIGLQDLQGQPLVRREEVDQTSRRFERANSRTMLSNLIWKIMHTRLEHLHPSAQSPLFAQLGAKNSYVAAVEIALAVQEHYLGYPNVPASLASIMNTLDQKQDIHTLLRDYKREKTHKKAEEMCEKRLKAIHSQETSRPIPIRTRKKAASSAKRNAA